MKILLTSDLHAGVNKNSIFINFVLDYLDYIKEYCKKNNIKYIMFLGDILEKSSSIKTSYYLPLFNKIKEIIDEKINIVYIVGNHEAHDKENNSLISTLPGKYIRIQEHIKLAGKDINFLSYTENKIKDLTGDYLFTHLSIENFEMNNNYIPSKNFYKASLFKNFKLVLSGHYHKPQEKDNVVYLGSPYQLSFAEKNQEKGFVILDLETDNWERVIYDNGPKFKEVYIDNINKLKNIENTFIKIKSNRDNIDFYNIKLGLHKKGALSVELDFIQERDEENTENILRVDNNLSNTVKKYLSNYKQDNIDNKKLLDIFERVVKEID